MNEQQVKKLLQRYRNGECSPQEQAFVDIWIEQELSEGDWEISEEEKIQFGIQLKNSIDEARYHKHEEKVIKLWPRIAAAAAVLLVIGSGLFFYTSYYAPRHSGAGGDLTLADSNIKPGSNKAILTLSDGSTINLDSAGNGTLIKQSGVEIIKTANGQLIYDNHPASLTPSGRGGKAGEGEDGSSLPSGISPQRGERGRAFNTISTPRGGQYQVRLPDGSKVWLNAASKLTYPVSFNGRGERKVELSGEAYFEIAKDKQHPFKVKTIGQEVEVLGTHFNINSYADEPNTKTTLLEGSILVSTPSLRGGTTKQPQPHSSKEVASSLRFPRNDDGVVLKPGEQALLKGDKIKVTQVDTELAIAWKNNQFLFESEPIQVIMRKIERWYDVSIEYDGQITDEKFSGGVSRFDNVSKVLKSLESTGKVHFRIEGKKIYVTQ